MEVSVSLGKARACLWRPRPSETHGYLLELGIIFV